MQRVICFALSVLASCCHSVSNERAVTAQRTVTAERTRTTGVALDPPSHQPRVSAQADREMTALQSPEPRGRVLGTLERLFAAIAREDTKALADVLSADAEMVSARGPKSRAIDHWTRRFERIDYTGQPAHLIYSPAQITVFPPGSSATESKQDPPLLLRPGELLVRVPIAPAITTVKLFGKRLDLALVDVAGEYKIRVFREDFELPDAP